MDGTAIDTDIDRFIRQQKSKLAAERHDLQNDDEDYYPKRSPRRQWAEPNKENYLSVDVKRQTEEKPATPAHQGYPVDNRLVVKKRKELSVERKKEYNDFLKTQPNNQRKPRNLTPTQKSINVGEYDERRKAMLNAERKKDYDDFMRKKKKKSDRLKPSSERLPIDDFNHYYYGGGARQQDDDYYGDYGLRAQLDSPDENFYLEELNRSPRVGGLPVGQYEQHKREFGHAIKANYRNDLQKQMKDNKKLLKYKPGYKSKKPAKDDRRQYYVPDDRVYDIERILDKSPRVGGLPVGQYEQRKRDNADETKRKYRHDLEKQVNFKQTLGKTQPGYKGDPMKLRTRDPMLRRQLRVQGSTGKSFDKWERKLHEPIKTLYDKGHDLRPYDLDDEWKRHQLDALNDIDRRQLELRLKIERDNALRHLEHTAPPVLSDEDVEEVSNCPVHIVREHSRSPSPVVVPRLYDPDQLEMYRESPEGLLIGETSTEHKEKLRQERQREYNEMMAQDQSGGRRQWGNPTSTRPAEDQPKNPGGSGGYFPADNSHIHKQQMAEERKREYQEMLEAQKKKQQEQRMNRMNRNSNQNKNLTNPSIQPAQTQNPSDSSSQPAQFQNSTSPSNQAVHFQNPANQEPIPPEPPTESMPNGHGGPAYGDSNGLTSPRREARPPPQQGQTQSKEPRRRIWKEDSQIDFFASRYPDKRNYPTAQDGLNLNGAPSRQIENNGYVPSAADLETLERRKEYEEMLKNQSKPRNRTYREPENVDFMSSKYTKPPRQNKDPLMDFLQEGPHPTARENSQRNTDRPEVNYNNASLSPQEEMRNEYNNMLKNKTPRRLYKEPSKEDFFDFDRIQRNNPVERKAEPRLVDEERRREYQAMKKANPRSRPFRENSSDDFMKHADSNRRVHGNGLSMTGSETFAEKERQYQAKVKASQQTPRRRMWREPTEDDFFISSRKYERQPQKRTSESFLL